MFSDSSFKGEDNEVKYIASYRDDIEMEKHQPLGIEITQELYYKPGRDWTVITLNTKNIYNSTLQNLSIGIKVDADVPSENHYPTNCDDLVGKIDDLIYLYDSTLTKEKSNIIGLLPLDEINIRYNWWNIASEPTEDQQKINIIEMNKNDIPEIANDYRILIMLNDLELEYQQERNLSFALIECEGISNAEKAILEVREYFDKNISPLLKKQVPFENQTEPDGLDPNYQLFQNYPNPFNASTVINYVLPEDSFVQLNIYNIRGELITQLENKFKKAGSYKVIWDGITKNGTPVKSGIFYYQIKTNSFTQAKKLIFLK